MTGTPKAGSCSLISLGDVDSELAQRGMQPRVKGGDGDAVAPAWLERPDPAVTGANEQ